MGSLGHLNRYLWKYKGYLILGCLFIIIANVFSLAPGILVREAFEMVEESISNYRASFGLQQGRLYQAFARQLLWYGGLILIVALLRGVFMFFMRQTIIVMSRHIEYDLKNELYHKYQSLSMAFYSRQHTGDLLARLSEDIGRVRMYVGPALMYGISLLTLLAMLVPFMFIIHFELALYALLPLPALSISVYVVSYWIYHRSERLQKQLARLSTFVQETFSGIRVLKLFAREAFFAQLFSNQNRTYRQYAISVTRLEAMFFPTMLFLIGLSTVLVIYVGAREVMAGTLSVGHIAEFVIYIHMLTWPVTSLGWATSLVQRAAASQTRINAFLQEPSHTDLIPIGKPLALQGQWTFEQVGFKYEKSHRYALRHISFQLQAGEALAVIGGVGSGKTTLSNLMCRVSEPTEGQIRLNQRPLTDYDLAHLRSQIGYVPQDGFLFSDTLKANILFGATEPISEERLQSLLVDVCLADTIRSFPDGLNTRVGERGITLSGGQKQRVSIARALVRAPKLLILDDCLSAVDTHTEHAILQAIKRHMKGRTTLIISHRAASAKLAQHILVLKDGQVLQKGTHKRLYAEPKGYYRLLCEAQAAR